MALKSVPYKIRLNLTDTDRNVYQDLNLTVAGIRPKPNSD